MRVATKDLEIGDVIRMGIDPPRDFVVRDVKPWGPHQTGLLLEHPLHLVTYEDKYFVYYNETAHECERSRLKRRS